MKKKYTDEEIAKAAQFRHGELEWIDKLALEVHTSGMRPFVILALCSAIIGNTCRGAVLKKKTAIMLVAGGVED